jgi:polyisoprenoid-binding protein YceI
MALMVIGGRKFMSEILTLSNIRLAFLCFLVSTVFPPLSRAQGPVFEITPLHSWIKFDVKASVDIAGKFDKWNAVLTFTSPDETTGDLEITIQAASVDTGSGLKNGKLKNKDFFDVEKNPVITFKSTKFVQTGPDTFEVDGDFTIRGVSNPEKLTLVVSGKGTDLGEIKGKMVFNRKDYGMNKGIPFIKIADHVDVNFHLKGKRVSGPPLALSNRQPTHLPTAAVPLQERTSYAARMMAPMTTREGRVAHSSPVLA